MSIINYWTDAQKHGSIIKNKQTNKQAKQQQPDVNDAIKGLHNWKERGNVRVKWLVLISQEHKEMPPARTPTQTARSRVQRAPHHATTSSPAPPPSPTPPPPTMLFYACWKRIN